MAYQVAVFMENQPRGLERIGAALEEAGIDIRAISIADAGEFGVIKLLVSDPIAARDACQAAGMIASLREIVALRMADRPGGFHEVARLLADAGFNIEDAYGFILEKGKTAVLVVQIDNVALAEEKLVAAGLKLLTNEELAAL